MSKQCPFTVMLPLPDRRLNPNRSNGKHWAATVALRKALRVDWHNILVDCHDAALARQRAVSAGVATTAAPRSACSAPLTRLARVLEQ